MQYARARTNKLCIDSIWNFAIYYAQQQQKNKSDLFCCSWRYQQRHWSSQLFTEKY